MKSSTKQLLLIAVTLIFIIPACMLCLTVGTIVATDPILFATAEPTEIVLVPTATATEPPLATVTPKPTATPEPLPTRTPARTKANWGTVDIRELAKRPDRYIGANLHYTGEIFTIQEDSDGAIMQIWVDVPGSDYQQESVVVLWFGETNNIFNGVLVEVWGTGLGAFDGTNAFGAAIRQPAIQAEHLTYFTN